MSEGLLLRADGTIRMGTGHIMRCLALAQAWKDAGHRAFFATADCPPPLKSRFTKENVEALGIEAEPGSLEDAALTIEHASKEAIGWVALDGYHFGLEYQRAFREAGLKVLFLDDSGQKGANICADLVLNQNVYANKDSYIPDAGTRLLLGARYALIRREFRGWTRRHFREAPKRILITLGGSDPEKITLKVLRACQLLQRTDLDLTAIVGAGNPHYEEIKKFVSESRILIKLKRDVVNMPALMAECDVAVTAGGTTCLELARMGLPHIILILAKNQRPVAQRMAAEGVALNLGRAEEVRVSEIAGSLGQLLGDAKVRREMSRKGQLLVDDWGAERVVRNMRPEQLRLRLSNDMDSRLLWHWANDPETREVSFSNQEISWDTHVRWYSEKLLNPRCFIFIAEGESGIPAGVVRFDTRSGQAVISVNLDRRFRGCGLGSQLIRLGSLRLFDINDSNCIHAYIKPSNKPSITAFQNAGYSHSGSVMLYGQEAMDFVLRKAESL